MDREMAKKLLGENATEEQVTEFLNQYHAKVKETVDMNAKLQQEVTSLKEMNTKLSSYEQQIKDIEAAKMTEAEKIAQREKELAEKERNVSLLQNSIKAKSVLLNAGVSAEKAEELVKSIVKEDETSTLSSAELLANEFKSLKELTEKQVKEQLANVNVKPNGSNVPPTSDAMTFEKFASMSLDEQNKFAEEHPDEFNNL